jgi:uncharacterized membrane protein HdeD (DUF308 family)
MTTTTESTESRPAEATGRIGKHGGWMLAFGILTIAAGIRALVWPGITLLAAAIVFGVQLIGAGIYRLIAAFAAPQERLADLLRRAADGTGAPAPLCRPLGSQLGRDAARGHVTPRLPRGAM